MHATNDDDRKYRPAVRARMLRRVIENVELSDRMAGERVVEAVRHRLAEGSHRVVITSADSGLPPEMVEHAFDVLRFSGLVCAPGTDGEIALLGMTQSHDALVSSIPWGTDDALDGLLRAARENELSLVILPPADGGRGS
jgi:glycosyltransferase A (GT-A) superfamily protein (DUF2064 family)